MKENMTKELETALLLLGRISVAGDAVDCMAAAKQKIRNVAAELNKEESADG